MKPDNESLIRAIATIIVGAVAIIYGLALIAYVGESFINNFTQATP